MQKYAVRAAIARVLSVAVVAAAAACTPLQVVTHSVSRTEASVPAGQYTLDPHHWSVTFDVEHLKYSRFTMRFDRASARYAQFGPFYIGYATPIAPAMQITESSTGPCAMMNSNNARAKPC